MKKTMISTAVLALLFASCSSDDGLTQSTLPLEGTPIQVNVAVADLQTRAGYDASNLPTEFYMNVTNPDNEKYSYKVLLKKESGNWNSYDATTPKKSKQMLWAGDNKDVKVTASSLSLVNESITTEVKTDQSTSDNVKLSDHLLMSTTSVTPSTNGIEVTLNHLMSKIKLIITLGDEFEITDDPFSKVSIEGTLPKRIYNLGTVEENVWSDVNGSNPVTAATITPLQNSFKAANGSIHASGEYEAILVPQTIEAGNFYIWFKVKDRLFEWKSTENINLDSGKEYTLKLMAGHDKVSSASFTTSAWNGGDTFSNETE